MKHLRLRRILLSGIALSLLPFSAACSSIGEDSSRHNAAPKYILEGTKVTNNSSTYNYLDFYTITSSEITGLTGYAVALNTAATCPTTITIPARFPEDSTGTPVVGIMPYGFRFATATSIEFKKDTVGGDKDYRLKVIDYEAFLGSSIQSIDIPWSIQKIGDSAFYECKSLQTVRFNSTNKSSSGSAMQCNTCTGSSCSTSAGTDVTDATPCTLTNIPAFCFFNCRNMTALTLPASIVEIEYEAFNGCSSLSSSLFFRDIKIIRSRAFQGCTSLGTLYFPNSFFTVSSGAGVGIEALAFNNCSSGQKFNFSTSESAYETWLGNHPDWGWYNETGTSKSRYVVVPTGEADISFDTDWAYRIDSDGVTITSFTIPDSAFPNNNNGFIVMPNELGGQTVRRVDKGVFSTEIKKRLRRLYLPTTLYAIENEMFNGDYKNLIVVDSRDHCSLDWDSTNNTSISNPVKRIDLSHLVDLQFIGYWAFCSMTQRKVIEKLHLPANLIAIGNEAFCRFSTGGHMDAVNEFLWDYDPDTSRLQVIGTDAFFKLGVKGLDANGNIGDKYANTTYNSKIQPTTIVFPKSFKYFGMRSDDVNEYKKKRAVDGDGQFAHIAFTFELKGSKSARPAHCFANCPLIGTVVFKGSMTKSETTDLVIPVETFVYNENLQTIVFEERKDHLIVFHTQNGLYAQQSIGSNGVSTSNPNVATIDSVPNKNDFRGRPFLQTIVLPTKHTKLLIQKLAFQGNPRAAMYLSGSYGNSGDVNATAGMFYDYYNDPSAAWTKMNFTTSWQSADLESATQWRTIGSEEWYGDCNNDYKGYLGYCLAGNAIATTPDTSAKLNRFYIDQKIPCYENVHYEKTFKVKAYVVEDGVGTDKTANIHVEVGDPGTGSLEFVEEDDCVYLCGGTDTINDTSVNKAIMAKYLYRLWPNGDDEDTNHNRNISEVSVKKTLTVPIKTVSNGTTTTTNTTFTVTEIGASAFSAAHCDGALKDVATDANNEGSTNDLAHVKLPNTIKKIGEYAFMRAYGVTKISAYDTNPANSVDYNMPLYLEYVGKNAFSFCNVAQFLNIPDDCLFYENDDRATNETDENDHEIEHQDFETTSVFTNNFSLRKITFRHKVNNVEKTNSEESNKYITSTYVQGANTYTTALYSKDTTDNANRLLIILNRDYGTHDYQHTEEDDVIEGLAYYDTPSKSDSPIQDFVKIKQNDTYPTFKIPGTYATNPFLYGAYKMAYWIKWADIGLCTTSTGKKAESRDEILNQPLFSGICKRTSSGTDTTDKDFKLYLRVAAKSYDNDITSDLNTASGEMFDMPLYGFNGCENLKNITLPNKPGETLPDGLFANASDTGLKYSTESGSTDANFLDLTGTGYDGIGEETFLSNLSIKKIKAPAVSSFTIGPKAFKGCTNLEELDLSPVTGSITIDPYAFENCTNLKTIKINGVTGSVTFNTGCFKGATKSANSLSITWPANTSTATFSFEESSFENCAGAKNITLPAQTTKLGKNCFKGCGNLASIAFNGDCSITSIGEGAFQSCSNLNSFDFTHLPNLTKISTNAFNGAGTIVPNGVITFGSSVVDFGATSFSGSKLVEITFSCSSITLRTGAFSNISTLTKVRFTNKNCTWNGTNGTIFSSCGNLTDLQLPKGFALNIEGAADMILGDSNVRLLTYYTYSSQTLTGAWRRFESVGNTEKNPVYYVEQLSDLSYAANLANGTITKSDVMFWTIYNGDSLYLGTLVSVSSSLVVFSEHYQMNSSGTVTPTA